MQNPHYCNGPLSRDPSVYLVSSSTHSLYISIGPLCRLPSAHLLTRSHCPDFSPQPFRPSLSVRWASCSLLLFCTPLNLAGQRPLLSPHKLILRQLRQPLHSRHPCQNLLSILER